VQIPKKTSFNYRRVVLTQSFINRGVQFAEKTRILSNTIALTLTTSFDLVLMDLQIPGKDGEATTQQVRRLGLTTPVVALTADVFPTTRERVHKSCMNGVLTKPINMKQLVAKIDAYFWGGDKVIFLVLI
jgi:CheY-like chemotaxis protein